MYERKTKKRKKQPPLKNVKKSFCTLLGGPFLESFLIKNRCRKWSRKTMSPKVCFGRFLADFGITFRLILATFGPSTSKKRRTGENVKMSTAPKREAHFRGFMGVENCKNNNPKPKIGHTFFEGRFGNPSWSHFGRFWAPKGIPK